MEHMLCAVWIFISLAVFGATAQSAAQSSVREIRVAANFLKLEVIVQTNHDLGGTYSMRIKLTNPRRRPMLKKKDWSIMFHHQNKIITPAGNQELEVVPAEGCLYVIRPKSGFKGLLTNKSREIAFEVEGLLLHKTEIFPNFAIYASKVGPINIRSTTDEDLSFVSLSFHNNSLDDLSRLSGIQRMFTWPDIIDRGGVGETFVIPAPYSVSLNQTDPQRRVIDLQDFRWHVLFDYGISSFFQDHFINTLSSKLNMQGKVRQVDDIIPGEKMIFVKLALPDDPKFVNSSKFHQMSEDGYNLTIQYNFIFLIAKSETGLFNGFQTLSSMMGKFAELPVLAIEDDARFQVRSVSLDLTKNFFPPPVIKKFIDVMAMYKLNHLFLNLADDHGWRLEMNGIDFHELHTFGSRRCIDQNQCLQPTYGAGAHGTESSSGYFKELEFKDIISYASDRKIRVIPQINYIGGMRAALLASVRRFDRLKEKNATEAYRLLIAKTAPDPVPLEDSCYTDGVLNPCLPETGEFIREINKYIVSLYANVSVTLMGIHAGGDEGVKLYKNFEECKQQNLDTPALLKKMVSLVQANNPVTTIVNEEAMINPNTNDCLQSTDSNGNIVIDQDKLVIVFRKDFPGDPESWNLTPEEADFLFRPIEPPPPPENMTELQAYIPDHEIPYLGQRRGLVAPWAKPYTCANSGYMSILNPQGYLNFESASELDFDERGSHKRNSFFAINLHRLMLLEPYDIYVNMDISNDMQPLLPYRLCQVFQCPDLTSEGQLSLIGLLGSIDTAAIRTEAALMEMAFPRTIMLAEKAWREAPFENALRPNDLATYINPNITVGRTGSLLNEMTNFLNTFGYKDSGLLDALNVTYRIGRIGAAINFGIGMFQPPPFPAVVKTDFLGAPIQYRDLNQANPVWRPLFWLNPATRTVAGGYRFSFPISDQKIELRQVTADGRRASKITPLFMDTHFLTPKVIPVPLREDTCLNVREPIINLADVNIRQWAKIINNLQYIAGNETLFRQGRLDTLLQSLERYRSTNRSIGMISLPEVLMGIDQLTAEEVPLYGVYKSVHDANIRVLDKRQQEIREKNDRMQNDYLRNCPQENKNAKRGRVGNRPTFF